MPTKRAVFIFFFSLIIIYAAWATKLVWFYFSAAACLGLIIVSYLLSHLLIVNMEIKRHLPLRVYENDIVTVRLSIRNRIPLLDQSVEMKEIFGAAEPKRREKTFLLHGLSRGSLSFSYQERCFKRGKYKIGPLEVKVFEPFGLFCSRKKIAVYSDLIVYPQTFQIRRLPYVLGPRAPRFGQQTTRISGDYEEFFGIREYRHEDGWRRIHWKSTARLQELMVRHFEQSSQWKAMVALDAQSSANVGYGRDTTFEYSVKIIASLLKYLMYKNASFGFMASTENPFYLPEAKGLDHYQKILDELAVIDSTGSISMQKLLSGFEWVLPQSSSLIVIINSLDPVLIQYLKFLKLKKNIGIIPVVLYGPSFLSERHSLLDKETKYKAVKKIFGELSEDVYHVGCRDDLKIHFA